MDWTNIKSFDRLTGRTALSLRFYQLPTKFQELITRIKYLTHTIRVCSVCNIFYGTYFNLFVKLVLKIKYFKNFALFLKNIKKVRTVRTNKKFHNFKVLRSVCIKKLINQMENTQFTKVPQKRARALHASYFIIK